MSNRIPRTLPCAIAALGLALGITTARAAEADAAAPTTDSAPPAPPAPLVRERGIVLLDYEVIPVPDLPSLDLLGFHFLRRFDHGVSFGIGGYAPLVRGEYGGFMTVDATGMVERQITGRWFANAGLSLGGGGGGKSAQQSKVLTGTGGYAKAWAGIGYAFDDFTVGANLARFHFRGSAISHTQPNLFVQFPFSWGAGPYASAGLKVPRAEPDAAADASGETTVRLGLDNFKQRNPTGSNKGTINLVHLQLSRFYAGENYGFLDIALGWRGLPLYNQVLAGIGRRVPLAPSVNLYGQVGIGSGGYAPDTIDTGPGLLVAPKVAAEWMATPDLGLMLTLGTLIAPRGTSRNLTYGASLSYRLDGARRAGADGEAEYRGYRFHVLKQTELNVKVAGRTPAPIQLLTLQIDMQSSARVYVPVQVSVATNAYVGYPGYGEVLVGAGVQSVYAPGDKVQFFGQLLTGPNVHGLVLKPQVGASVELSDTLALHAQAGHTMGIGTYGQNTNTQKFRANDVAVGLSYRFSALRE